MLEVYGAKLVNNSKSFVMIEDRVIPCLRGDKSRSFKPQKVFISSKRWKATIDFFIFRLCLLLKLRICSQLHGIKIAIKIHKSRPVSPVCTPVRAITFKLLRGMAYLSGAGAVPVIKGT